MVVESTMSTFYHVHTGIGEKYVRLFEKVTSDNKHQTVTKSGLKLFLSPFTLTLVHRFFHTDLPLLSQTLQRKNSLTIHVLCDKILIV